MTERTKVLTRKSEEKRRNIPSRLQQPLSPVASSPLERIMSLQRTVGNQAVQRLFKPGVIHAKLKIGHPNNMYEQEADRVAEQVMRMPGPAIQMKPG